MEWEDKPSVYCFSSVYTLTPLTHS